MAGDVNLPNPSVRDFVQIFERIEAVIKGRDKNVVYVKQDAAIRQLDDLAQKLPLGHVGKIELSIAAYVFNANRNFYKVLHVLNSFSCIFGSLARVRNRQEVVRVAAVHTTPAEVIRNKRRLCAFDQALELLKLFWIIGIGRTEIERNPVLNNPVMIKNLLEHFQWSATTDHIILRDDLEPIDLGFAFEDVGVVRDTKADPDPEL